MSVKLPLLLDSTLNPVRNIHPARLSLDLELSPLSSAEMELMPDDDLPVRSWVAIYKPSGLAGIFRSKPTQERYGSRVKSVELEHGAAEMNDYIVTADIEQSQMSASAAINTLFGYYRGTKWALGTVAAYSTVVIEESSHPGVLDAIISLMDQVPECMMMFDQSQTPWRLNIVPRPANVTAEGRLSRNIESLEITYDVSNLCNRVYMDGVTPYVEDTASQAEYGIIEKRLSETGYTPAQSLVIASAYLDAHKRPRVSVSISAIDFSGVTGETLDQIDLGIRYRLAIPDDHIVIEELITSIRYDDLLDDPYNPQITLAERPDDLIAFLKRQGRSGAGALKEQLDDLEEQYQHWSEENNVYKTSVYKIMGVTLDQDGNVIYQVDSETGEYILDEAGNKKPVYDPQSTGSISGKVTQTAQNLTSLYEVTGVASLPSGETSLYSYTSKVKQTADNVSSEVSAARGGQASLSSKLSSYLTISAHEAAIGSVWVDSSNKIITAASIATAINATEGTSAAHIDADHIYLTGTTTMSGQVTVEDGQFTVKTTLGVKGSTADKLVTINDGKVSAKNVQIKSGGNIVFVDTSGGETNNLNIGMSDVYGAIKSVSVEDNVLTLTRFNNTSVNFSKATTLTGAVESGTTVYKVSATQTNKNTSTGQNETTEVGAVRILNWDYDQDEGVYTRTVQIKNGSTVSQTEYLELPAFTASWATGSNAHQATYTVGSTTPNGVLFETAGYLQIDNATISGQKDAGWKLDGSGNNTWKKDVFWHVGSTNWATIEFNASGAYNQGVIDGSGQSVPARNYYEQVNVSASDIVLDAVNGYVASSGMLDIDVEATCATNSIQTSDPQYYSDSTVGRVLVPVSTEVVNASQDTHSTPGSATWVRINLMSGSNYLYRVVGLGLEFPNTDPSGQQSAGVVYDTALHRYTIIAATYNTVNGSKVYYSQASRTFEANAAMRDGKASVTLDDPQWSAVTGDELPANRQVSVSTIGRTNLSGASDNLTKTVSLFLTTESTWTNHQKPVYLRPNGASASNVAVAQLVIDAEDEYLAGRNSVNVSGPVWSNTGDANDTNTATFSPSAGTGTTAVVALTVTNAITAMNWNSTTHRYAIGARASVKDSGLNERLMVVGSDSLIPTDAIEYGKSQVSVSASFETATVPSGASPTVLSSGGKYRLLVTKDGATVQDNYYSVPAQTAQRSATSVTGSGTGGMIPLTSSDVGTPTKTVTVNYDSGSPTTHSVTINAAPVYTAGQNSVYPTSATISTSTLNSSTGRRTSTLYVRYKGPSTEEKGPTEVSGVDVTSIYNAGKSAGQETNSYPVNFRVTFEDDGSHEHTGTVSVDCADIYNQGAHDGQQLIYQVYYTGNLNRNYPIRSEVGMNSTGYATINLAGYMYKGCLVNLLGFKSSEPADWDTLINNLDNTNNRIHISYEYDGLYQEGYVPKAALSVTKPSGTTGDKQWKWVNWDKVNMNAPGTYADHKYPNTAKVSGKTGDKIYLYHDGKQKQLTDGKTIHYSGSLSGYENSNDHVPVRYLPADANEDIVEGYVYARYVSGTPANTTYMSGGGSLPIINYTIEDLVCNRSGNITINLSWVAGKNGGMSETKTSTGNTTAFNNMVVSDNVSASTFFTIVPDTTGAMEGYANHNPDDSIARISHKARIKDNTDNTNPKYYVVQFVSVPRGFVYAPRPDAEIIDQSSETETTNQDSD